MNIGDGASARYYSPDDKIPTNYQLLLAFEDESFLVFPLPCMVLSMSIPDGLIDNKYYKLSKESISPLSDEYTSEQFDKLFSEAKKRLLLRYCSRYTQGECG